MLRKQLTAHRTEKSTSKNLQPLLTNLAWFLFVYAPSLTLLIWSSTVITSRYGMRSMDKYMETNYILFGFTQVSMCCFVCIICYNWKRPEYRCRLPWFLVHLSLGLILFPLVNFIFAHRIFTSIRQPKVALDAVTFTIKVVGTNILYTSLILRLRVMYLVYCRGIYEPRYPLMLVRMGLMIIIFTVIPVILEQTIPWCEENTLAIKGVRTLRFFLLLEFAFYMWKLRKAARQFVDYQPAVRMWCAFTTLLFCAILLPEIGVVDKFGELWFEVVVSYWVPMLMWCEFFGFVVVKDICVYFNCHWMDNVESVSRAFNLLDPRGELDIILSDEELWGFLLDISQRRLCEENCTFIRDINLLGDFGSKHAGVAKFENVIAMLQKYIYTGASTPVNIPGHLKSGIRKIDIGADSSSSDWHSLYELVLEARAYVRQLLGESKVLVKFEKDPRVVKAISKHRRKIRVYHESQ